MQGCECVRCVRYRAVLTMALALPDGDPVRQDAIELLSPLLAAHVPRPPLAVRVTELRPWPRERRAS